MNFCPHCGTKTRTPEDRFCSNCGAVLQPAEAQPATDKTNLSTGDISSAPVSKTNTEHTDSTFVAEFTAPPKKQIENEPVVNPDVLATDLLASISRSSAQGKYKPPVKPEASEKIIFQSEKETTPSDLDRTQVFALPSQLPAEEPPFTQAVEDFPEATPSFALEEDVLLYGQEPKQTPIENLSAPAQTADEFIVTGEAPTESLPEAPQENLFSSAESFDETEELPVLEPALYEDTDTPEIHNEPIVAQKNTAEKAAKLANLFSEDEPAQPSLQSLLAEKDELEKSGPPPLPPLPPASRKKRDQDIETTEKPKSVGKKIATIFIGIIVFVVATAGVTLGMLYWNNRPSKTFDQFISALQAHNYASLNETVSTTGFAATNEGWDALGSAFSTPEMVEALRQEQEKKPGETRLYSAITLAKEPLFLFINRYYIQLTAVEVLIPSTAENTQLNLGGTSLSGRITNDGMLYSGIMPGMYTATLTAPGGASGASFIVNALDSLAPNRPDAAALGHTITIENCISDDAVLYINSVAAPEVPVGGTVTLANVPLGSEIIILARKDGATMQAQVIFNDAANTTLRFEEYMPLNEAPASSAVSQAGATQPTQEEIDTILYNYYTSYLNAINEQNIGSLQLSTQSNNKDVESRIQKPGNKDNLFAFVSAQCDPASIVAGEENGVPSISFNATFGFSFKPRDNSAEATNSSNRQTVQLLYVEDKWMVNRLLFVSDADFEAHKLATPK